VDGNIPAAGLGVETESADGDARGVGLEMPNEGIAGGRELACVNNLLEAKKFGTALVVLEGFSGSTVFSETAALEP
jgi:hypothetical protein